jgi:hypothetical protein
MDDVSRFCLYVSDHCPESSALSIIIIDNIIDAIAYCIRKYLVTASVDSGLLLLKR